MQVQHGAHVIDDDVGRIDIDRGQAWLTDSSWSAGITRAEVARGFSRSTLTAGAYAGSRQDACLRVGSDSTRFAYIHGCVRRSGGARTRPRQAMIRFVLEHPELALVNKWLLATKDAHGVYRDVGFTALALPNAGCRRAPRVDPRLARVGVNRPG